MAEGIPELRKNANKRKICSVYEMMSYIYEQTFICKSNYPTNIVNKHISLTF